MAEDVVSGVSEERERAAGWKEIVFECLESVFGLEGRK